MDCHSDVAHQLDFDSILTMLSQLCLSAEGVALVSERTFLRNEGEIESELALIQSARSLIERMTMPDKESFPPVAEVIKALDDHRLASETVDLYRLARYLSSLRALCAQVAELIADSDGSMDELRALFASIPDLEHVSKRIFEVIDDEGALIIANIEPLDMLQQQRMDAARDVESQLKRMRRRNSSYYQSANPVMRNNRFCLALNAKFFGRIPSVVVDQSSSGDTLFIEPLSCVETNNRWVRYSQKFEHECRAFILALIAEVRKSSAQLQRTIHIFSFLDFTLARAQFSIHFDCHPAEFTTDSINLRRARHPLLGDSAVPIDVTQDPDCYATVISGPNGGGKTVTLKTIGLLILMHYFAMHIPATEGSRIPRCDRLLLLIGDQQSILSHKSSFTAQMEQTAHIMHTMNSQSIVLFDELGGNTDPEEGAALATAIVSFCMQRKAQTFVTTHFTPLKEYAIKSAQAQLISMEYDHQNNKPRFTVVRDLPEGSHAFDMAINAGLDQTIVKRATELISGEAREYKKLLTDLTRQRQEVSALQDRLVHTEAQLRVREQEIQKKENGMRDRYIHEIERLISSSRAQLERLISKVREKNIALPTKDIHSEMDAASKKLSDKTAQLRAEITSSTSGSSEIQFSVGDVVHLDGRPNVLTVSDVIDDKTAEVFGGKLRMKVPISRLTPAATQADVGASDTSPIVGARRFASPSVFAGHRYSR